MSGQEGDGRWAGPIDQAAARRKADRWSKAPVNRGEKKLGEINSAMCGKVGHHYSGRRFVEGGTAPDTPPTRRRLSIVGSSRLFGFSFPAGLLS